MVIQHLPFKTKCQFCKAVLEEMIDLQLHQVASCTAIEGGCCGQKRSEIIVVFRWMTETTVVDCVHIILSDVDSQIELRNVFSERYDSDLVSMIPGKY